MKNDKPVILILDNDSSLKLTKYNVSLITVDKRTDILEKLNSNNIDVLFLNINMPEISGQSLAREIRENELYTKSRIPMMALTTEYDNVRKSIANGFDKVIRKPIDAQEIKQVLRTINIEI